MIWLRFGESVCQSINILGSSLGITSPLAFVYRYVYKYVYRYIETTSTVTPTETTSTVTPTKTMSTMTPTETTSTVCISKSDQCSSAKNQAVNGFINRYRMACDVDGDGTIKYVFCKNPANNAETCCACYCDGCMVTSTGCINSDFCSSAVNQLVKRFRAQCRKDRGVDNDTVTYDCGLNPVDNAEFCYACLCDGCV